MAISAVTPQVQAPQLGSPITPRVGDKQPASETQVRERRDTLELSSAAQGLRDTQRNERIAQIQSQINSGYYNRPEVLRETASRAVRDLFPKDISI